MSSMEHIYSVLVVSASEKLNQTLTDILPSSNYYPLHFVNNVHKAQTLLLDQVYDLVIINAPLPDDLGIKLAMDISSDKYSVVMMILSNDIYDQIYEKIFGYGIFCIRKPLSKQLLLQTMDWMRSMREKLRSLEKKSVTLHEKMAEIRIINRAKWLLIDNQNMSETQAHHYIEKQAMNHSMTKKEVAERIIEQYS